MNKKILKFVRFTLIVILSFVALNVTHNFVKNFKSIKPIDTTSDPWGNIYVVATTTVNSEIPQAHFVEHKDYESFKSKYPNCSFIIPKQFKENIEKQLGLLGRWPEYKLNITDLGQTKQKIELFCAADEYSFTFVYEASQNEIKPLHKIRQNNLGAFFASFILFIVLFLLIKVEFKKLRNKNT